MARWSQVKALLESVCRDKIQSKGSRLAKTRFSSPFRLRGSSIPPLIRGIPPLTRVSPSYLVMNYEDTVRKVALDDMMQQLLDKRCVKVMADDETNFFSRVFLVPKSSRGWRLVIDRSMLNHVLVRQTFEIDTLTKVEEAPRPGMWDTLLDMSDVCHHISMRQSARKFMCFPIG